MDERVKRGGRRSPPRRDREKRHGSRRKQIGRAGPTRRGKKKAASPGLENQKGDGTTQKRLLYFTGPPPKSKGDFEHENDRD